MCYRENDAGLIDPLLLCHYYYDNLDENIGSMITTLMEDSKIIVVNSKMVIYKVTTGSRSTMKLCQGMAGGI